MAAVAQSNVATYSYVAVPHQAALSESPERYSVSDGNNSQLCACKCSVEDVSIGEQPEFFTIGVFFCFPFVNATQNHNLVFKS